MRCPGNKGYARVWLLASGIENGQQFVKEIKRSKRKPEGVRGSGTIRVSSSRGAGQEAVPGSQRGGTVPG